MMDRITMPLLWLKLFSVLLCTHIGYWSYLDSWDPRTKMLITAFNTLILEYNNTWLQQEQRLFYGWWFVFSVRACTRVGCWSYLNGWDPREYFRTTSGSGWLGIGLIDTATAAQTYTTPGMSGIGLHGHVGWWLLRIGLVWLERWLLRIGLVSQGSWQLCRYWA